jgi:hypothetical protein
VVSCVAPAVVPWPDDSGYGTAEGQELNETARDVGDDPGTTHEIIQPVETACNHHSRRPVYDKRLCWMQEDALRAAGCERLFIEKVPEATEAAPGVQDWLRASGYNLQSSFRQF